MHRGTNIYFASDFHLGVLPRSSSREREAKIVSWLDSIKDDAKELYLVGDIFDFWFEYRTVVPKGFIRFLGKLSELADRGVKITLFKGNHDMWMFGYLQEELGASIVEDELTLTLDGKTFYIHHGDGLGSGDGKYKLLKRIFRSPLCQWLFARIHPNLGIGIAQKWSRYSRGANEKEERPLEEDREWLIQYAKELLVTTHYDYFIFGHRHFPYEHRIDDHSHIINLGDWIHHFTYAVWDGDTLALKKWMQ